MIDQFDLGHIDTVPEVEHLITTTVALGFMSESAARQRHPHHLGISALSGCTRAAVLAAAKADPSDQPQPDEGRAANLGTAEHTMLLPRLAERLHGAVIEREIVLRGSGLEVPGHIDLDTPTTVADLKTVGEWRLQTVRRTGPYPDHVMQVAAYAVAKLQAGEQTRDLALIYLDRASGDVETIVIPMTNKLMMAVVDRLAEIRWWINEDPDNSPRQTAFGEYLAGPGRSWKCNTCPWLRRCWGDDVRPYERMKRQISNPEVEALLREYLDLTAVESGAKRRKAEILAELDTAPYAEYGELSYRRPPDTMEDDGLAAVDILRGLGHEIPQKPRKGRLSIRFTKRKRGTDG